MLKKRILYIVTMVLVVNIMNPMKAWAATSGKNITWKKTSSESQSNNYYDVTFNQDKIYVAVGAEGSIVRSADAKVWKTIPLKTTDNLYAIATNGKQFVAVGSNGMILQSVDGKSWTRGSLKVSYTYEQIAPKMKSYYEKVYQINWKAKAKQSQFQFRDIIWDGKKYVAIAQWEVDAGSLKKGQEYNYSSKSLRLSGSFVVTSKDGKNWETKFMDTPYVEKIVYTGKQYTAISEEAVSSSKDLVKWKTTTPNIRGDFSDLIYSNGKYLAIGWDGNISARTGTIYTSTDGVKWKAVINKEILGSGIGEEDDTYGKPNGFSDLIMNSVIWDGKQYVIAGHKGMILTSSSGTNWKMLNDSWNVTFEPFGFNDKSGPQANINQIIYDGEQYVLVGNNSTILVTSDLITGTVVRTKVAVNKGGKKYYLTASSVVWNGKQFVTMGGSLYEWGAGFSGENVIAFSTDGITWTLKNADDNYYKDGTYGNKTYIAVDGIGDIYYSTNGIDYTKSEKATGQPINKILWDGKKFIAVGEKGTILVSTKDKIQFCLLKINGQTAADPIPSFIK